MLLLLSLAVGVGALGIGCAALIFPAETSGTFGIKAAKGEQAAYVRVTGARDVFIGLTFLYLYTQANIRALAFVAFATGFVSTCDFLITRKYGSKLVAFVHLGATLVVCIYGWALMRLG